MLSPQEFEKLKTRLIRVREQQGGMGGNIRVNPITGRAIRVETPEDIMRGGQQRSGQLAPATQALGVAQGREGRGRGNILTRTLDSASKATIGFAGSLLPVYKDIGYDIAAMLTVKGMKQLEQNQEALFSKVMERLKDPNIPDYRKAQYVDMFRRINPDLISGVPEFNRTALQRVGAMVQTAVTPAFFGKNLAGGVGKAFLRGTALQEVSGTAPRVSQGEGVGTSAVRAIPGALLTGGLFAGARALAPKAPDIQTAARDISTKAPGYFRGKARGGGGFVGETILGTKEQSALGHAWSKARETQQFIKGTRSYEKLGSQTRQMIGKASNISFKAFDKVVRETPAIKISKGTYNTALKNVIKHIFGIERGTKFTMKDIRALDPTTYGFGETETKLVQRLLNRVFSHPDELRHARGVLQLRQVLDKIPFGYKGEGFQMYNKLYQGLRRALNTLAADKHEPIRAALKTATKEMSFLEKARFNLIGGQELSAEQAAIKLEQASRNIFDPLRRRGTVKLLQMLRQRTGFDLEELLKSAYTARQLHPELPGLQEPVKTAGKIAVRTVGRGAIEIGKRLPGARAYGKQALDFIRKLPGPPPFMRR